MLTFWIIMAAVVYFTVLACVLVFFAAVSKMNRHWERVFRETHSEYDEKWYRAA